MLVHRLEQVVLHHQYFVMNRNDKLRIDVMSHDKQEVLDCEKVIQKLILEF
jgi:hypothetical protein